MACGGPNERTLVRQTNDSRRTHLGIESAPVKENERDSHLRNFFARSSTTQTDGSQSASCLQHCGDLLENHIPGDRCWLQAGLRGMLAAFTCGALYGRMRAGQARLLRGVAHLAWMQITCLPISGSLASSLECRSSICKILPN